jgi:uncharacterized SAM-binding protein YcdF (DUF218 family)
MKFLKAIIAIVAVFFLVVWGIGAYLGPDALRGCDDLKPSTKKGCEKADAIVAISGGDTTARANEAIALYKNGWADLIIFSGAAADKTGPSNALVMKQQAIDAGIDPNVVVIEETSETTGQNAAETISIFKQYGVKSAILVTSAYHERRAMIEFDRRALGLDLRPHPVATDKQWSTFWWTTSTGWSLAVPELFRSLVLSTGGVDR